jgi:hypothetical protein
VTRGRGLSPDDLKNGLAAGFAGTLAMSIFVLLNDRLGFIPQIRPIHELTSVIQMLSGVKLPSPLGFLLHLVLGSFLFGCLFAVMFHNFTGNFAVRGLMFGLMLWIGVMSIVCPMLGQGFFALRLGLGMVPAATWLFFHGIYGLAMGAAFGSMQARRPDGCQPGARSGFSGAGSG